jgi:hypothetical protein
VQARGFNALFGEKINPVPDGLQNGHAATRSRRRGQSSR